MTYIFAPYRSQQPPPVPWELIGEEQIRRAVGPNDTPMDMEKELGPFSGKGFLIENPEETGWLPVSKFASLWTEHLDAKGQSFIVESAMPETFFFVKSGEKCVRADVLCPPDNEDDFRHLMRKLYLEDFMRRKTCPIRPRFPVWSPTHEHWNRYFLGQGERGVSIGGFFRFLGMGQWVERWGTHRLQIDYIQSGF